MLYLDSSAIAKLLIPEDGSAQLEDRIRGGHLASSDLSRVEVLRAVRRVAAASELEHLASRLLDGLVLIHMDRAVLERAARIRPPALRSMDAIHLATALELRDGLSAFLTYDRQLGSAAAAEGLAVEAPGAVSNP